MVSGPSRHNTSHAFSAAAALTMTLGIGIIIASAATEPCALVRLELTNAIQGSASNVDLVSGCPVALWGRCSFAAAVAAAALVGKGAFVVFVPLGYPGEVRATLL